MAKKYIPMVKAIMPIENMVEAGKIYKRDELLSAYPFLDLSNTKYFESVFNDEYKKGDLVRYTGSMVHLMNDKCTYVICDVKHKVSESKSGLSVTTTYTVKDNNDKMVEVTEENLCKVDRKWIISFSDDIRVSRPAVHELDWFVWDRKIRGTWKSIFVFDTKEEAERVSEMFAVNPMDRIYYAVSKTVLREIKK